MLDYKNVDKEIYQKLINLIYSNRDIARKVINGAYNGGYSFLLMSLFNFELELTDQQKAFAVDEAMNKVGTARWEMVQNRFARTLDDMGINDESTTIVELGGSVNPIGSKSGAECMYYLLTSLGQEQAHGAGEFDIRYHILRNPNWTTEEKQKLIMDFWTSDHSYENCIEQWEWDIVNDEANLQGSFVSPLEPFFLYDYTYNSLLKFYGDKDTTDRIWAEIQFCKQMRELRPPQHTLDTVSRKRVIEDEN